MATVWAVGLWEGCALGLLAFAVLRMMPHASAALRHSILLAVFALAAVLPFLRTHATTDTAQTASALVRMAPWFAATIALLWITASTIRAVSLAWAWMHLRRVRRNSEPVMVDDLDHFTAGKRSAVLRMSDDVSSPAVLGFFHPILLMPRWLVPMLSPKEMREIALHECEHLRRRDDWINLAVQFALVLMPLNPALLWMNRRLSVERELACDAAVIASTAKPLAYAASLTRMAEQRMQHHSLRLALAALGRRSELALRVQALLSEPGTHWTRRQSALATGSVAVVLMLASSGLARTPHMIAVGDAPQTQVANNVQTPRATLASMQPKPTVEEPTMKMVPVMFEVRPAAKPHHKNTRHIAKAQTSATSEATPAAQPAPHFLRTAFNADTSNVDADTTPHNDNAVRFVPTQFVQPYVAVPIQGGWLIFEL